MIQYKVKRVIVKPYGAKKQHPYVDGNRLIVIYRITALLSWAKRNYWPEFQTTGGFGVHPVTHTGMHAAPLLLQHNGFMIQVNKRPQAQTLPFFHNLICEE